MDQIFKQIDCNLTDNSIDLLVENLKIITEKLKDEEYRIRLNDDINNWLVLDKVLKHIFQQISDRNKCVFSNKLFIELIIELFRVFRNSLVNCLKSKQSILSIGSVIDCSFDVFQSLFDCYKNGSIAEQTDSLIQRPLLIQSIKCCLQFFANMLSGLSDESQELVQIRDNIWTLISFDLFRQLLEFESDRSVGQISSMIFFSCVRNNPNIDCLFETTKSEDLFKLFKIFELLLKQIESQSSEWSLWSIETMVKSKNFLSNFYYYFENKQKLILLDVIHEMVCNESQLKEQSKRSKELNDTNVQYLCDLFKQNIADIVKIDSQTEDITKLDENKFIAINISKLLSILCELSTNDNYSQNFRTDRQLMECLVDTLKTIQLLGKSADSSHFKTLAQLRQISETDSEAQNPVFGFKRNIIRLIANLVYKCPVMQDWIREMDGIPLILDCCNVDAKNPYIMQWSIFAIRNIVDNNHLNRELLSQLSRNGVLIDDQLSERLGLN